MSGDQISQYVHSIQPDMTCVTVKVYQLSKVSSSYRCEVVVEGREGIISGTICSSNNW